MVKCSNLEAENSVANDKWKMVDENKQKAEKENKDLEKTCFTSDSLQDTKPEERISGEVDEEKEDNEGALVHLSTNQVRYDNYEKVS